MLESLELINFQCHKDVNLEFDPGVNVIAGTSDMGKSAILKGLLWLITNRPQGLGFRNMQAKKNDLVAAKIILDGHEIIRSRNEAVNEYVIDGQKFVAMKNDVPKEIVQFLNLLPVNIQTQFQPHYLLSGSPGEVAKVLNESCDLAIIDTTMKRIKTIEQSSRADARAMENQEKEIQDELADLEWVDAASEKAEQIKSQMEIIDKQKADIDDLFQLLDVLERIEGKISDMAVIDQAWTDFQAIHSEVNSWQEDTKDVDYLSSVIGQILSIDASMGKQHFDMTAPLIVLQKEMECWKQETSNIAELDELLVRLGGTCSGIAMERGRQEAVQAELAELWKSIEVCPLCGQKVG